MGGSIFDFRFSIKELAITYWIWVGCTGLHLDSFGKTGVIGDNQILQSLVISHQLIIYRH